RLHRVPAIEDDIVGGARRRRSRRRPARVAARPLRLAPLVRAGGGSLVGPAHPAPGPGRGAQIQLPRGRFCFGGGRWPALPPLPIAPPCRRQAGLRKATSIVSSAGECPERQRGRTVNPLSDDFVGSSPTSPTSLRAQALRLASQRRTRRLSAEASWRRR